MKIIYVFAICLLASITTAAPLREFLQAVGNKIHETAHVATSEIYDWFALGKKLVFGKEPEVTTVSPTTSQESLYKWAQATKEMVDKLNKDNEDIKKNLAVLVEKKLSTQVEQQYVGVDYDPDRTEIGIDLRSL